MSEAAAALSLPPRPLRWPWAVVAGFAVLATDGSILVFHNGESFAGQAPFVDGSVRFEVRDDGRGFDPGSTGYGTGLQGIADRLSALGESVQVRSGPGSGTTVTGEIPALPAAGTSRADAEPSVTPSSVAHEEISTGGTR